MSDQLQLLEKLVKEYPDCYIKIGDNEYFPIRSELWNFEYIKMRLTHFQDEKFKIEKYNEKPIVVKCDEDAKELINAINHNVIYDELKLPDEYQLEYYLFMKMITMDDDIFNIFKNIEITLNFWTSLAELNIEMPKLSMLVRLDIINELYKIISNDAIEKEHIKIKNNGKRVLCKYKNKCRYYKNRYKRCNFLHPYIKTYIVPSENKLSEFISSIYFKAYDCIYLCTSFDYDIKLSEYLMNNKNFKYISEKIRKHNYDKFVYRPKNKTLYKVHKIKQYIGYREEYSYSLYILDATDDCRYDLDTELKRKIKVNRYNMFDACIKLFDMYILAEDGSKELVHVLNVWKPYNCGYKCKNTIVHNHGN